MRVLLVLALVHGMTPALGEAVEAVGHYALTGHLAHSGDDHGDLGEQGPEHGCSPTAHHCDCCSAQPVIATQVTAAVALRDVRGGVRPNHAEPGPTRALEPPFRPPIG